MNYLHSYHAGCIGDVFKHALLLHMLQCMLRKEGAVTVLDTHAGRGLYDLQGAEAQKTHEAEIGIIKAAQSSEITLAPYLNAVQAFNPKDELRYYPGSPAFIAHALRSEDLLILNELHPEEAMALRGVFKGDKQVRIHERDAYEIWPALTPPETSRGLFLVDPPFEKTDEYENMTKALVESYAKCQHAVIMMWYPLKERPAIWRWHESLIATGIPRLMMIEHCLYTDERADRMNGAGFVIANPPYSFQQTVGPLLEAIRKALQPDGEVSSVKVDWLTS
ncbi:MAG: 23S rRNA (adenine(2030)-N(6))-methyltransferase RlmJ [Bdellovibrionales bacterium]